jgi:hypothetical protein
VGGFDLAKVVWIKCVVQGARFTQSQVVWMWTG